MDFSDFKEASLQYSIIKIKLKAFTSEKFLFKFYFIRLMYLAIYAYQVSISSTFYTQIFVQTSLRQLFSSYMYVEKAAQMTFVRKILM